MFDKIEITYDQLFKQSMNASKDYLTDAKNAIDKTFGEGYAQDHPDLMAAYMRNASIYFAIAATNKNLQSITAEIVGAINQL